MTAMAILKIEDATKSFGGLVANSNISFEVQEGALLAIIGPNGAGKTTLFNMISGSFAPTRGRIIFDGADITGHSLTSNAQRGLVRTYQLVQLFKDLTVVENVEVGLHRVTKGGIGAALFRPAWARRQEAEVRQKALELLDFVGLSAQAEQLASELPYGRQRLLEVARALATSPRVILLDEPAAGLNTTETANLAEVIRRVNQRGVTVLLIEHDMDLVMQVADRIVVLDFGKKIAEGAPDEIKSHPDVIAAYLGDEELADV
jgi:branched-chain amino acid transport system ATP-binding protein